MSKPPPPKGPLAYPNLITDAHANVKMREMIDHANALKLASDQTSAETTKNTKAIAALPTSFISPNDVNAQIVNWASSTSTSLSTAFLQVLNTALKGFGFSVPHPPPAPTAGAIYTPAGAATTRLESLSAMHWGTRTDAPQLGRADGGFLYYVSDYAHLAFWDGANWQLIDGGGGYFVDAELELGVGWHPCDGSVTDYMVTNTPSLEVRGFTTYRYRSLRRHNRRYFRR
jgi:hypothetical protein